MEDKWCSTAEAAKELGCDPQTILNYIAAGVLVGAQDRERGRWRVFRPSVDRVLAARERQISGRATAQAV